MKKILCAGCSHTAEFHWDSWPAYIHNSTNVGIRGAGPDLVSKRVITALQEELYTHCIVQWPDPNRWDLFIENETHAEEALPISGMQKSQRRTFVDLNGHEVDLHGYCTPGSEHRGYMKTYYKQYWSPRQHQINFWNCVLNVQLLCEHLGVKVAFVSVLDLVDYGECPFNFVDKDNFLHCIGMYRYLAEKGYKTTKDHYPTEAHQEWAKFIKTSLTLD